MNLLKHFQSKTNYTYINEESLIVGTVKKTRKQFNFDTRKEIEKLVDKMDAKERSDHYSKEAKLLENFENLETAIFETLKREAHKVFKAGINITTGGFQGINIDYKGCIRVIDVFTNERIVFNTNRENNTGFDMNGFDEWLREQPTKVSQEIRQQTIRGVVEYDPYNQKTIQTMDVQGDTVNKVNSHQFPDWRRHKITDPELPQDFKDLMAHLFPDKECRRYMLFWMKNAIEKRNYCHLILNSPRGTGKGTFMEIMKVLVGDSNYKTIDTKFFESRFNYELRNRRICYFDEHPINKENINQYKAYGNPMISIEGKGLNIGGDVQNYASYVISNNGAGMNLIASDERKFSVPRVTRHTLLKKFGVEWIQSIVAEIRNNPQFAANVGWWLLNQDDGKGFDNQIPYKSEVFWDLVDQSLTEWQRTLVGRIEANRFDSTLISDLAGDLECTHRLGRSIVEKFVDNHTDRDGDRYAAVHQKKDGERWLIALDKYKYRDAVIEKVELDVDSIVDSTEGWG